MERVLPSATPPRARRCATARPSPGSRSPRDWEDPDLTEEAFDDLRDAPVATVERIYTDLAIDSWAQAKAPIARRAAQSSRYRPLPVTLEPAAEQRLITLLGHG